MGGALGKKKKKKVDASKQTKSRVEIHINTSIGKYLLLVSISCFVYPYILPPNLLLSYSNSGTPTPPLTYPLLIHLLFINPPPFIIPPPPIYSTLYPPLSLYSLTFPQFPFDQPLVYFFVPSPIPEFLILYPSLPPSLPPPKKRKTTQTQIRQRETIKT